MASEEQGKPVGMNLSLGAPPPRVARVDPPLDSRQNASARKRHHRYRRAEYTGIVIERDYSRGMHLRFVPDFPDELNGHNVSPEEFAHTIHTINQIFDDAESWSWINFCEAFIACTSLYSLWLCWTPYYERKVQQFREFLHHQNETVYHPKGLHCLDPILNGLLHFEILVVSTEI